jgi:hypothetical protein
MLLFQCGHDLIVLAYDDRFQDVMKKSLLALALAIAIGVPSGWLTAMLLTPVLWRLEPVLHMELAGHAGPSDWIFYVVWAVVISGLFVLLRFVILSRRPRS